MCGIFGVTAKPEADFSRSFTEQLMRGLFKLSESRGKEAAGIALHAPDAIYLAKYALPASKVIDRAEYRQVFNRAFSTNGGPKPATCIIGHSRLVTNGGHQVHANNQPAVTSGMVGIHNGIITNVDHLWAEYPALDRQTDLDTEVLLSLIRQFYGQTGDLVQGIQSTFDRIEGVASTAILFTDLNLLALITNNGSLYLGSDSGGGAHVFASERHILEVLFSENKLRDRLADFTIRHIEPGTGLLISLDNLDTHTFTLQANGQGQNGTVSFQPLTVPKDIVDLSPRAAIEHVPQRIPGEGPYVLAPSFVDEYPHSKEAIAHLRRCTRCVLPETMPFIEFDDDGVCNYCRDYRPIDYKGLDALAEMLKPYRKTDGSPDCLVPLSGGRDSSYVLHFLKTVVGMNPLSYTYDWGMVTDLARRNQMRLCGKLGVEHILVSANLARKRANIRKNVSAWLKQPDLGMVPLFMAGDKQHLYYANKVARETQTRMAIFGENLLETTRFKSGFCGLAPKYGTSTTYALSLADKFRMAWYYGVRYLKNPAYLNSSMLDTIGAYISYYVISHNQINLFQYIQWDEDQIVPVLIDEYNWETAPDTTTTWRIGDGTASFYNYIYYTIAGLTENDTFRSNQVREGVIDRDTAIRLVDVENQPRYESMQWYCDVIGIDFYDAVRRINAASRLYPRS
ncbi:MAG: hypothetical protein JXQ72_02555 [Anaerolineae bacterium]|nr:hypothetical protein [Anaerolineae bacterium]